MEEIIKIGFTGNRYGLNSEQKVQIISILDKYNNLIVSHGDCVGSDTDFHNLCLNYKNEYPHKKIMIHIYPSNDPKFRAFNKSEFIMDEKPYLQRNLDIVKNSSILIACPNDKNKEQIRSGTWSTIRKAIKQKLTTIIL